MYVRALRKLPKARSIFVSLSPLSGCPRHAARGRARHFGENTTAAEGAPHGSTGDLGRLLGSQLVFFRPGAYAPDRPARDVPNVRARTLCPTAPPHGRAHGPAAEGLS